MRIKKISSRSYKGKVFDLTVNETHTYNIEGCAVHNSAAGSMICYILGITKINPMKYDLLFNRFLNEGRAGTPKIFDD